MQEIKTTPSSQAFLEWYEPIHASFIRYCSSKSLDLMPTEDLAQEAILVTLSAFDRIRDKNKLLSYMIGIVNNIIKNHLRQKKFRATWNEQTMATIAAKVNDPEIALDIQYLYQCIHKLKDKEKEAILLFEISGFSIKEISVIQQSSSAAVKTRLHRARKTLKELVAKDKSPRSLSERLAVYASILF
ncbi:RNA polymerase sigma factor [Aureispira sp. CCB-QB1]|uniref:RNA polymerase sigma factor n=1 Tax=Aureispira sp. CCB-QB1 TaxID=1313421 RepID=UPI0006985AA6|nr:RNA polymerase sigma factor [Aureispira sp. CCB-QB1]